MMGWEWKRSEDRATCWLPNRKIGAVISGAEVERLGPPYRLLVVCNGVRLVVEMGEEGEHLRSTQLRAQRVMLWLEKGTRRKPRAR
jgi:hypothetical protein